MIQIRNLSDASAATSARAARRIGGLKGRRSIASTSRHCRRPFHLRDGGPLAAGNSA
jgi:hypothetical protein